MKAIPWIVLSGAFLLWALVYAPWLALGALLASIGGLVAVWRMTQKG